MQKRGQISIFLILGVVIVLTSIIFLYFTSSDVTTSVEQLEIDANINSIVESCLESAFHEGIQFLSAQSGFYQPTEPYYEYFEIRIPYLFAGETLISPTISNTEKQINLIMHERIQPCLTYIYQIKDNVEMEEPIIQSKITEDQVDLNMKLPIKIYSDDAVKELSKFSFSKKVQLGQAIKLTQQILQQQEEFPNDVRTSFLTELGDLHNINFNLIHVNNTVLYNIIFTNENFYQNEYKFQFAMRYNWQ
tara:strand:- start:7799 stop:8542 length:744 start_codon:yes stop_codon:yes gene_type:complete